VAVVRDLLESDLRILSLEYRRHGYRHEAASRVRTARTADLGDGREDPRPQRGLDRDQRVVRRDLALVDIARSYPTDVQADSITRSRSKRQQPHVLADPVGAVTRR